VTVSHSEAVNTGGRIGRRAKPLSLLDARILEGIALGESNLRMAGRLHLSRQGIEYRVAAMPRRFRAPNRAALVSRPYTAGLLSVSPWPPKVPTDLVE
jgi:DNA-binding NarL/FixJ family response regulator